MNSTPATPSNPPHQRQSWGLKAACLLGAISLMIQVQADSVIAYGRLVKGAAPFAVAVNADPVAAIRTARLDLIMRGYVPLLTARDSGRGYYAIAGNSDAVGNLLVWGVSTACPTQLAAQDLALQKARANGAKQPKVLRVWADIDFAVVRQLAPTAGQVNVHRPTTFTWAAVPMAGKYNIQIEYLAPNRTAVPVDSTTVAATSYISEKLGPGRTYRWRIQAVSEEGSVTGPWSAWRSFSTRVTG